MNDCFHSFQNLLQDLQVKFMLLYVFNRKQFKLKSRLRNFNVYINALKDYGKFKYFNIKMHLKYNNDI